MKNNLETRLGIFFAVAVVAAFIVFEMVSAGKYFSGGYHVHGLFSDVHELQVGAPVKKAGVPIGQVAAVGLEGDRVKVTLRIEDEAELRTDTVARIEFKGLLGENFISVGFGTPDAPRLRDDATIQTEEQPDLNALMTRLDNVASGIENITRSFSGDSIQNVLGPLTDFIKENNPKISAIFDNLQDVTTKIREGEGTVGKLITDDALYTSTTSAVTNLSSTADELRATLGNAQAIFSDAKAALQSANTALSEAEVTLTEARKVVVDIQAGRGTLGRLAKDEQLYTETTIAMENLKEILQKINRGDGSVGKLVNEDDLYRNAKVTLQKVEKATESIEDTGPLSVLGTAVNSLF